MFEVFGRDLATLLFSQTQLDWIMETTGISIDLLSFLILVALIGVVCCVISWFTGRVKRSRKAPLTGSERTRLRAERQTRMPQRVE